MNAETEMATADGLGGEQPLSRDQPILAAMREWIADCGYAGLDYEDALELLDDAPDDQIRAYIERHHHNGVAGFVLDWSD